MSTLEELTATPVKTAPDVWVQRLVILAKLIPQPVIVRDVKLRPGLNIVWAEEPESDTDTSDIAGHSAGKTSFCRLLRYVLGERTFANKGNTLAVKKSFPNGYVAAEICIKGSVSAVLRPLGDNRNSYVRKGATIEDLFEDKGEAAYQDNYPEKLGLDALLHDLASSTVVRTNETIQWGHLLAWCTRDQEARFQNVFDWRSPRSESEWPAFRFPKADPLFVMRVTLGLFLPDELKAEETLAEQMKLLEKTEAELERAKREPDFWSQHYDSKLRLKLTGLLPGDAGEIGNAPVTSDDVTFDLKRFVSKAKYLIEEHVTALQGEVAKAQAQLDSINEEIAEARTELDQLRVLFDVGEKAGTEISAGLKDHEVVRERISKDSSRVCHYGGVLIGECSYVKSQQQTLKGSEVKEAHALEQMEAARTEARAKLIAQCSALVTKIRGMEAKRTEITNEQRRLSGTIRDHQTKSSALDTDLAEAVSWKSRVEGAREIRKAQIHGRDHREDEGGHRNTAGGFERLAGEA